MLRLSTWSFADRLDLHAEEVAIVIKDWGQLGLAVSRGLGLLDKADSRTSSRARTARAGRIGVALGDLPDALEVAVGIENGLVDQDVVDLLVLRCGDGGAIRRVEAGMTVGHEGVDLTGVVVAGDMAEFVADGVRICVAIVVDVLTRGIWDGLQFFVDRLLPWWLNHRRWWGDQRSLNRHLACWSD